jgi:hypothetical protein
MKDERENSEGAFQLGSSDFICFSSFSQINKKAIKTQKVQEDLH